jgi:ABC-type uncharacterized transport system auxiliary subunit
MSANRMNRLKPTSPWLVLALVAALQGCTSLESRTAPIDYRLELDSGSIPQGTHHGGILRIERVQADAGVNTRGIAYRLAPYQLQYYTKSRWTDTPARMLRTIMTSAFDQSGLFTAVIDSNQLSANYLLTSQLLRLEQQLPADGQPSVRIQFRYQLVALPERHLLKSGLIDVSAPASASNAPAAVAAANAALSEALQQLVPAVAAALPKG